MAMQKLLLRVLILVTPDGNTLFDGITLFDGTYGIMITSA
jgi:hypothetical protein